ncbi:unnamed protein product (macronuclear) [Paramecium tetraurelia]|uniref:Rab-GAP TBC domain-containing protein n=1 Tax=Paramecium tetraurelia TaxID=5888 RepID=A0DQJ6_PARTE|nr:uncharacterized protein GSPATT00002713001 [Paramecium tetraurelia]CAK85313.1 unnamed protein product [Paramecium tetraurelia]|eukprot:XP_001452710.1 hypothetical protein (macronuclear) [Paramecium tetraurelia strain d4-2]
MGNQTLCAGEGNEVQVQAEIKNKQRKVTYVQQFAKLDNEQPNKQSLIATHSSEKIQTNSLNDWLETLHESVLISQIDHQCYEASTKYFSEIDDSEDTDDPSTSTIDQKDLNEYQKNYPYCNSILDMIIINFYVLQKYEFKMKLIGGPPKQRMRWSCWQLMAYIPKCTIQSDHLSFVDEDKKQVFKIKKDTHRTVSTKDIKYFESGQGKQDLEKVLIKLSKLFPKLGYCQGMNFLAGFTLIINNKNVTQSLQFLAQMMINPKFLIYYLFSEEIPLLKLLEFICQQEIKFKIPDLHQHIYHKLEVSNAFWLTKIIMTMFLYNFHLNNVCRFWDFILATNIFQISTIICSFLEIYRNQIFQMDDLNAFIIWFDKHQNEEIPDSQMNYLISKSCKQIIKKEKINSYANLYCIGHTNNHQLQIEIANDYQKMTGVRNFIKKDIFDQ